MTGDEVYKLSRLPPSYLHSSYPHIDTPSYRHARTHLKMFSKMNLTTLSIVAKAFDGQQYLCPA